MRPMTVETPTFAVANPRMAEVIATAGRAAYCDGKVLITGESGVGKDLVARYIHANSARRALPFVAVNCCCCQRIIRVVRSSLE